MVDSNQVATVIPVVPRTPAMEDLRWLPLPGEELAGLLALKLEGKPTAQGQVSLTAQAVLGRGIPYGERGSDTGLVVGYVQSGKTLSFTAVMALARDNGFQLIIVVAGSSAQLSDQSHKRIRDDLRVHADSRRVWALYQNPKPHEASGIEGLLDQWRDPHVPQDQRQTVLITVMKQHTHLRNLSRLLTSPELNLAGVSALIIDDEADQASLNTQSQQNARLQRARESTTYTRLMQVRRALPSHTYLQYTATPQAPLLISIIDSLSARWVEILEPGDGYTGGLSFFGPARDRRPNSPPPARTPQQASIVRIIPATDIPSSANPIQTVPSSLQLALRLFMVGVAAAYARGEASGNRSMLIHPSVRTADHQTYLHWVNDLFYSWRATLRLGEHDAAAQELMESFRPAYDDIALSAGDTLPSFEQVKQQLRRAFNATDTKEVNRRQGGAPVIIEWRQRFGWILVGGQAMDRGFTVEGLTVTYMPRSLGVGHADSMQQRARFFGYKASYLGYCRVFLERQTKQAFEDYVEHEEFIRKDLISVRDARQSLQEWPRRFVLDPTLKPCRDNVLRDSYDRSSTTADEWFTPQAYIGGAGVEQFNQEVVARFTAGVAFHADAGDDGRTQTQRHLVSGLLPLRSVVEGLLADYRVRDPGEVEKWTGLMALLGRLLDEGEGATATVYRMSFGSPRRRGIYPTGRVKQFFQGEYPVSPKDQRGTVYPGDRAIKHPSSVTVQIHVLDLTDESDTVVANGVPFLAVHLPATGLLPVVTQDQPNQTVL